MLTWYAYVQNDPVNFVDLFGLETTILVIHSNRWWKYPAGASHVAVHFSNPSGENEESLYDPSGSYEAEDEFHATYRTSSGVFIGKQANLNNYINDILHRENGETVNIYKIDTTPDQEAAMIEKAFEMGGAVMTKKLLLSAILITLLTLFSNTILIPFMLFNGRGIVIWGLFLLFNTTLGIVSNPSGKGIFQIIMVNFLLSLIDTYYTYPSYQYEATFFLLLKLWIGSSPLYVIKSNVLLAVSISLWKTQLTKKYYTDSLCK